MPESENASSAVAELERAFAALANYDTGSSRAGLVPIDQAVSTALVDSTRRNELELRLLALLERPTSVEAAIYILTKLRLVGSATAVPALAARLPDPNLCDAARAALEYPAEPAADALRRAASSLQGNPKIGVLDALGHLGDQASIAVLSPLLKDPDIAVAEAAAAALGRLGTPPAAQELRQIMDDPPAGLRLALAHAGLDCASGLAKNGAKAAATELYDILARPEWPQVIGQAARRARQQLQAGPGGVTR